MVKERYQDLLIEDDIKKILNDDKEFNDENEFLIKRIRVFTILWVLSMVILTLVVRQLSDVF